MSRSLKSSGGSETAELNPPRVEPTRWVEETQRITESARSILIAPLDVRPKVLIIDDDQQTVAALKRLLKPGFDVEGFTDSEQATRFIRDGEIDVAMVGVGLLDQIKQSRPEVPVAVVSQDVRPETIVAAMRRGACDFITKPVDDARSLAMRLTSLVTQSRSRRGIDELLCQLEHHDRPMPRYTDARQKVMGEFQRSYLERLMHDAKGNLSAASRLSGIDRANLRRALQKHKKAR